ncbi:hypothetical protein [Tepidibacter formicigenes]|jgi:predicted transposase YdaD|uniref:Transposase n=1 Tax=Tepidibacter formicigenes DSM 15518 TaxID=1123349 RepID=A0A1M6M8R1_9FIRM|nr:hypothetical protein [Tepidibacter formicigenes]SHJ79760.1 hypothetical protein SAMN02744037_00853 [Tepidibacter formicigenes DSM 15518]
MAKHKFKKGEYEEAVEHAKESLLDKKIGIGQIINETGLSKEQINKIQNKIQEEINDK